MWRESRKCNKQKNREVLLTFEKTPEFSQIIFEIEREVFEDRAWNLALLEEELRNDFTMVGLLSKGREGIGYIIARLIQGEAEILRFAIRPMFQGRGLGKILLQDFIREASLKGVTRIYLEVSEKNKRAYNFYKKMGFHEVGVRRDYYSQGENAFVMEYNLEVEAALADVPNVGANHDLPI